MVFLRNEAQRLLYMNKNNMTQLFPDINTFEGISIPFKQEYILHFLPKGKMNNELSDKMPNKIGS